MAELRVEIAKTPIALAHGLMFRKSLDENSGMLFEFGAPTEACFWGKNTYIPLDIAFVDKSFKIAEIKQITPMSTRFIKSSDFCIMAIEANAGFFKKHNLNQGCKITISNMDDNTKIIKFENCSV